MEPVKVLIVDDEPLARELLAAYLVKLPGFQLVGACGNALEAFSVLSKQPVDLLLLDINMPEITGMDLLKTLKDPPRVIFTTAYSEHAVASYELNAVDYLLKPITFDRFIKAIHKYADIADNNKEEKPVKQATGDNDILFVKSEGKMIRIDLQKLWFVEGYKNYVRLWTEQEKIIVHSTMKNFEDQLASIPLFIRISKSYIINLKFVAEVDGNCVRIKNEMLPIGNTYKDEVQKIFDRYKLM